MYAILMHLNFFFFEELGGARGSYWELIEKKTIQGLELQRENTQHWAKETKT